jgi:hypothetical protein
MNDKMLQEYEKSIDRTYKLLCEQTDVINVLACIYENDKLYFNDLVRKMYLCYNMMRNED